MAGGQGAASEFYKHWVARTGVIAMQRMLMEGNASGEGTSFGCTVLLGDSRQEIRDVPNFVGPMQINARGNFPHNRQTINAGLLASGVEDWAGDAPGLPTGGFIHSVMDGMWPSSATIEMGVNDAFSAYGNGALGLAWLDRWTTNYGAVVDYCVGRWCNVAIYGVGWTTDGNHDLDLIDAMNLRLATLASARSLPFWDLNHYWFHADRTPINSQILLDGVHWGAGTWNECWARQQFLGNSMDHQTLFPRVWG